MNKKDIAIFIEEMEFIGDKWTPEQVKDVYSDSTLVEALEDRKSSLGQFFNIIGEVVNRE